MVGTTQGVAEHYSVTTQSIIDPTTGATHRVTDLIEAIEQGLTVPLGDTSQEDTYPTEDTVQGTPSDPSAGTTDPSAGSIYPSTGTTNGIADSSAATEQDATNIVLNTKHEVTHPSAAAPQTVASNVALVTGAARGMGRSFANQLLSIGYKVCIADIMEDQGLQTCQQLAEEHGHENVTFAKCDVTKDEDFENAWTVCSEKFGPVALLVNNAGIGNEKNWPLTLNINLGGCIRGTNLAMEKMGKSKGGKGGIVINIASVAGLEPHYLGPVYSATKHGIVGFTRSMGNYFYYKKTNVKVMCLCPSLVETEFLADSALNASSEDGKKMLQHIDANIPKLGLEEVDKGFMKLIIDGKNGSVLVLEKGKDMKYVESKL